jgi:hypothetical protein
MAGRLVKPATGIIAAVLLVAGAIGLSSSPRDAAAQEEAAIQATVQAIENAANSRDVGNFLNFWTDQGFEAEFGFPKSDLQELSETIGDPITLTASNIVVEDGTATADIELFFGTFTEHQQWTFVLNSGRWQVDNIVRLAPEIPAGATVVDVQLDEYEFIHDPVDVAAGGNIAFAIENIGQEAHELVLFRLDTTAPLLELLESEDEEPEGLEFLAFAEADPGESSAALPSSPLTAGRYGIVCFFPAPDGTPHAFLGMVSEFNVGGGGTSPITPPSTGNGGLAKAGDSLPWQAAIALGAVLMTVSLWNLKAVRKR